MRDTAEGGETGSTCGVICPGGGETDRGFRLGPSSSASERGFGLVEALIALIILSVGLLAIAGIALSVSAQAQAGVTTTQQVLAGQQVLEATVQNGYSATAVGTSQRTVTVGNQTYTVTRDVTQVGSRVKQVEVTVQGVASQPSETLVTTLHAPRAPPTSP